jgi:hypothetical protein
LELRVTKRKRSEVGRHRLCAGIYAGESNVDIGSDKLGKPKLVLDRLEAKRLVVFEVLPLDADIELGDSQADLLSKGTHECFFALTISDAQREPDGAGFCRLLLEKERGGGNCGSDHDGCYSV